MSFSSERESTRTTSMDETTVNPTMTDPTSVPVADAIFRENDRISHRLRSSVPLAGIQDLADILHQPTTDVPTPAVESSTYTSTATSSTLSRQSTPARQLTPSTISIGTDYTRDESIGEEPDQVLFSTASFNLGIQHNDFAGIGHWTHGQLDNIEIVSMEIDLSGTEVTDPETPDLV